MSRLNIVLPTIPSLASVFNYFVLMQTNQGKETFVTETENAYMVTVTTLGAFQRYTDTYVIFKKNEQEQLKNMTESLFSPSHEMVFSAFIEFYFNDIFKL
jgi:hypothetical protein